MTDIKQSAAFSWIDLPLNGDKMKLMEVYQQHKLKLNFQNAVENRRQASAVCLQGTMVIIFCRYLFLNSNLGVNNDCLTLLLTPQHLTTIRHNQDVIWDQLHSSIQFLPATESHPGKLLALILQKAFSSTCTVLNSLDDSLSNLHAAYEEDLPPDEKSLLQLHSALGEAAAILKGFKGLLDRLPPELELSPQGTGATDYTMLQLTLSNMELLLASSQAGLTAMENLRRNYLLERHTAVLRQLFTLGAVLLPLIFIASLYGMRFEHMQELSSTWGYPLCLLVMALVALTAWWRSKK